MVFLIPGSNIPQLFLCVVLKNTYNKTMQVAYNNWKCYHRYHGRNCYMCLGICTGGLMHVFNQGNEEHFQHILWTVILCFVFCEVWNTMFSNACQISVILKNYVSSEYAMFYHMLFYKKPWIHSSTFYNLAGM